MSRLSTYKAGLVPYAQSKMVERDTLKIAFVVGLVVMLMLDPLKKGKRESQPTTTAIEKSDSPVEHTGFLSSYCDTVSKRKCTYLKGAIKNKKCKYKVSEYIYCDLKGHTSCKNLETLYGEIKLCMIRNGTIAS